MEKAHIREGGWGVRELTNNEPTWKVAGGAFKLSILQ